MTDGQPVPAAIPVPATEMVVSIIGGSGFIGRHLIDALVELPSIRLIALTRGSKETSKQWPNLTWLHGDMEDPASLRGLLRPGGILVHLAYPTDWDRGGI
jgi:uncharacterized protein YbjT (DUF2867 family)